jgi:hypothetical protein
MNTNDNSDTTFRWYQIGYDVTEHIAPQPGRAMPVRVWQRCLVTPDIATYLCAAEQSTYFYTLDYVFQFDDSASEDDREWWNVESSSWHHDGFYVRRSHVFDASDRPYGEAWAEQGEDTEDDAREWAQGNHLI